MYGATGCDIAAYDLLESLAVSPISSAPFQAHLSIAGDHTEHPSTLDDPPTVVFPSSNEGLIDLYDATRSADWTTLALEVLSHIHDSVAKYVEVMCDRLIGRTCLVSLYY